MSNQGGKTGCAPGLLGGRAVGGEGGREKNQIRLQARASGNALRTVRGHGENGPSPRSRLPTKPDIFGKMHAIRTNGAGKVNVATDEQGEATLPRQFGKAPAFADRILLAKGAINDPSSPGQIGHDQTWVGYSVRIGEQPKRRKPLPPLSLFCVSAQEGGFPRQSLNYRHRS